MYLGALLSDKNDLKLGSYMLDFMRTVQKKTCGYFVKKQLCETLI